MARQNDLRNTRDPERAKALFISNTIGLDTRALRYGNELQNTDLTADFKSLTVPTLVIPSVHDDESPGQGGPALAQWSEIKLRYPSIPLTVVPFENTRSYAVEEAPMELDRAIADFLAAKTVEVNRERRLASRPSPRASVMQAIGSAEVTVTYSRPQLKERKLTFNNIWRARMRRRPYRSGLMY